MGIYHEFVSGIDEGENADEVRVSNWNAKHAETEYYPMLFRLTLESGVPISFTDQSAKTTLYLTPYNGNTIALYDGSSSWTVFSSAQMSLSLSGYTTARPYDIWVYNNSGTPTMASTIWTNATTRGTALAYQDGVLVKSGATNYRYIGTIYTSATGQCSDTEVFRGVWNMYNRVYRYLLIVNDTNGHEYESSRRLWNNTTTNNLLTFVIGQPENVTYGFADGYIWGADYEYKYIEAKTSYASSPSVWGAMSNEDTVVYSGFSSCTHPVGMYTISMYEYNADGYLGAEFDRFRMMGYLEM